MTQIIDSASARTATQKKVAQQHFRTNEPDLPKMDFSMRFIDSVEQLNSMVEPWQRLVETSLRPNLFLDPGFLIPAFEHLNDGTVRVLAIDAPLRVDPNGPRVLCGLFPIRVRKFYGMPLKCLEVWKHDQCFDCTPLIRRDCAHQVLKFLFENLGKEDRASLLSFDTVAGDGEFQCVLTDVFFELTSGLFRRDIFNRACFIPMEDSESFIKTRVSKSSRKNTALAEKKLRKEGELTFAEFQYGNSQDLWINDFLRLESSGWKGSGRTALASVKSNQMFFKDMARLMLGAGKMSILKASFNDRPICMLIDIHEAEYGVSFKIAFDEAFAAYSPGLIVELHNIKRLHDAHVQKMDSCADPNHPMINRVWKDRMTYQSFVVALGGQLSRFAVASMPLIQATSRILNK